MPQPATSPYGSWKSPITPDMVARAGVGLGQVRYDGGDLYWVELRPSEGGRLVIVRCDAKGKISDVTPPGFNARTTVHEYGGGQYFVNHGVVTFSNFDDQRLYGHEVGDAPHAITPETGLKWGLRFADCRPTPDGNRIVGVQEQHHDDGSEATNTLVTFPADGFAAPTVIASGRNFFSNPRVSPDGKKICWLAWDHPNMPWDGTEVWVAEFAKDGAIANRRKVAGGPKESIFQPEWSPEGVLHFVSDSTGWWNLYREQDGQHVNLTPLEAEVGVPQWIFGYVRYAFLSGGRIVFGWYQHGHDHLSIIQPDGSMTPLDLGYVDYYQITTDGGDWVWFIGGSVNRPLELVAYDTASGIKNVLRRSAELDLDEGYISTPQSIEFPTERGLTAHAIYYPPMNKDFDAPPRSKPPLRVLSHGGPTAATTPDFNLQIQYWTSRGFAIVDVNYGGSTGYGRPYRERLNGMWGVVDVEDCVNAAKYLIGRGEADPNRVAIEGGSAGGYTTLCALAFTDFFKAGASYFGIGDLETMVADTHKFESRYCDVLVANTYPAPKELLYERSAIHFTDRISAPMILFQGLEDKIVPPNQAEDMVRALQTKGLPYAYLAFEGEQHGFRKAETNIRCLEAELYFYGKIFKFDLADKVEAVKIENLK